MRISFSRLQDALGRATPWGFMAVQPGPGQHSPEMRRFYDRAPHLVINVCFTFLFTFFLF